MCNSCCSMNPNSKTSVDLPRLIVPKRHSDDRGWFSEFFHKSRLHDIGITCDFIQDNQSSSKRTGTLRGLHFQFPPAAQAKLVTILRGNVLDVAVASRRYQLPMLHQASQFSARSRFFGEPGLDQGLIGHIALVGGNLDALKKCHRQAQGN